MIKLAAYAVSPSNSRGRRILEELPSGRSDFQRDRDRIIHSTAFRRLEYKTQVFVNHEGDLFRTRLTHSLEVAQIGRSIARSMHLNEDLVEAISLAHDLGHTPFGHAGQDALNECMKDYGGFEHNIQSLRVVDVLEERYAAFNGLNLCHETREGILKHVAKKNIEKLGELGERFSKHKRPSLEAQLANFSDEIAYNNHDIDDGLRSGLINLDQMEQISIFSRHITHVRNNHPSITERRMIYETLSSIINTLVNDLIQQSNLNIKNAAIDSLTAVHNALPLISFSSQVKKEQQELKNFLHTSLYRHFRVMRMNNKARYIIQRLFAAFKSEIKLLPDEYQRKFKKEGHQVIADYIAGMTDRYAIKEYQRLFTISDN